MIDRLIDNPPYSIICSQIRGKLSPIRIYKPFINNHSYYTTTSTINQYHILIISSYPEYLGYPDIFRNPPEYIE